jgi:response regulator RpfG family c-di-GMP phosphodiesterase
VKIIFYSVPILFLKEGNSFDFPVYLFDVVRKQRVVFIYPNSLVSLEQEEEAMKMVSKGAHFQIHHSFLDIFLQQTGISVDMVNDCNRLKIDMIDRHEKRLMLQSGHKKEEFVFQEVIHSEDNFKLMREQIQYELLSYPLDCSSELNCCLSLVEKLFLRESKPVKNACISYFIAKNFGMTDKVMLGKILFAGLVKDIGFAMVSPSILSQSEGATRKGDPLFLKHPYLSLFYLSKAGVDISKETKRLIMEHHELCDGTGSPRGKKQEFTHPASYILNLAEQVVNYSEHKGCSLVDAIRLFVHDRSQSDINTSISPELKVSLENLITIPS